MVKGGIEIFRKEQKLAIVFFFFFFELDKRKGLFGYANWRPHMKSVRSLKEGRIEDSNWKRYYFGS
jgi:hypothetical protein